MDAFKLLCCISLGQAKQALWPVIARLFLCDNCLVWNTFSFFEFLRALMSQIDVIDHCYNLVWLMSVNSFQESNTRPLISLWLPLSTLLFSPKAMWFSPPPSKRLKKLSDPLPPGAVSHLELLKKGDWVRRKPTIWACFSFCFLFSLFWTGQATV